MNIFYCTETNGRQAILNPEESAHCIRVLRMQKGDHAIIIDGRGGMYDAVISKPDSKQCHLEIVKSIDHKKNREFTLHIAIAPTKNIERFEWFIEKSIEIGIDIITPLICQRSERRVLKTDRIHKLIVSSMKQAVVPYMPVLHELTDYGKFIEHIQGSQFNRFVAHCDETDKKRLQDVLSLKTNVIVLIGPEGDFTSGEIDLAIRNGFLPVTLGINRMRTETAGVVACCIVNQ
jgi:16S rRNA (uracil1498-N3)-methyltransferase